MKMFYRQERICEAPVDVQIACVDLNSAIEKTRQALNNAYTGFDNATDADLIDSYIYEINALQKRYKYLVSLTEVRTPDEVPTLSEHPAIGTRISQVLG